MDVNKLLVIFVVPYGRIATAEDPGGRPLFGPLRLWHNWCTAALAIP